MTRVHLIGVCGTAMATLAALLKSKGFDVRGSDQNVYPPMSDFLVQQGITLLQGYRPEHITADLDLAVVGNAISRGNPELEEVLDRKIRYCSLPEAVRDSTHYRTLFLAALTLFFLTFAVNTVAEIVRLRFRRRAYQL